MSKPIHPIRKMWTDLWGSRNLEADLNERKIARHVKPLLDALWKSHRPHTHGPAPEPDCATCRLLAAWKAKL